MNDEPSQSDTTCSLKRQWSMGTTIKACAPPVLIEIALILMARVGLLRSELPWLVPAWCLAFVGLALAWRWRAEALRGPGVIFAWAVLFRVTLLPCVPDLSDDFYRYLWDGWLTSNGVNPYRFTPADPALAEFAAQFPIDKINSKQLYSVYPPLTQLVAAGAGAVYTNGGLIPAFVAMKSIFVTLELIGIAGLIVAATHRSTKQGISATHAVPMAALYAWNPLAILAIAGQGHSEAGLVFGIGVAACALVRGLAALSWAGLALAMLAKLTPVLAAPLWWRYWRCSDHVGKRAGIWAGVAVVFAGVAPFWFAAMPGNFLSSLRLYVQWFEFNAPVYSVIKGTIAALAGYDSSKQLGPLLALVTLMVAWLVWRLPTNWKWAGEPGKRESNDATCATSPDMSTGIFDRYAIIISAFLLLATTVHPWYALAALVLAPLSPVLRWSWVWFSFASLATYFAYGANGRLHEWRGFLSLFIWAGFAIVASLEHGSALVFALLRRRGRRKAEQITPFLAGTTVLDLGSGEGFVALALAGQAKRSGIERTLFLCDVASVNRTGLPSVVYDGLRLPFAGASIDTVILSLVLHHSAQPATVIREAARVSRRRIIVTESTYENVFDRLVIECLDRLANRLRAGSMREQEKQMCFRTVPMWSKLFEACELKIVETRWLCRVVHKHVLFVLEPCGRQGNPASQTAP